ncbi:MAG: hypothetical protein KJZ65_00350 [Phycisphaerales bacterium]|nr:hypothetical protein [Phycisphaerales bacterium]
MSFDDLKYKLGDVGTNLRYKLDDLKSNPNARTLLIGGGAALVLILVFAFYTLPRLLPGSSGPGAPVAQSKAFKGSDDDWIAQARAALASDPRFASVRIGKDVNDAGSPIIVIRGPMMDMPDRIALGAKFQGIGQPPNLVYQLGTPEDP